MKKEITNASIVTLSVPDAHNNKTRREYWRGTFDEFMRSSNIPISQMGDVIEILSDGGEYMAGMQVFLKAVAPPLPGGPCWEVEERELLCDDGDEFVRFTPILKSPLCSPIRFAHFDAEVSEGPEFLAGRKNRALESAKAAFRMLASEVNAGK